MTSHPDDLAAALHAAGPDPAHAEQLRLFGRFAGAWDIEWHGSDRDGKPATMTGELHFGRVLGGCPDSADIVSGDDRRTWHLDEQMFIRHHAA